MSSTVGERSRRPAKNLLVILFAIAASGALGTPNAFAQDRYTEVETQDTYPGCGLLLEGQDSECIRRLQKDLNDVDSSYNLPETTYFGPKTRAAILDFQADNGLPADGNAGSETVALLVDRATSRGFVESPKPGRPLPPRDPNSNVLAESCNPETFASLSAYLSGQAGAPACFPYSPDVEETTAGTRAMDPFDDGCSGPTPYDRLPAMYDFRDACAAHDYAYDLLRYGVDSFTQTEADNQLWRDWRADCKSRAPQAALRCTKTADDWRVGLSLRRPVKAGETITSS